MRTALISGVMACAVLSIVALHNSALALTPNQYREQALATALRAADRTWRSLDNPSPTLGVREIFMSALAYCEARTNLDRLDRIFEFAARMQDRKPESRSYGNFRWSWGHDEVLDYNAVDFCMQTAAMLWIRHRDTMPAGARARLRELITFGLQGLRRHRVAETYTNIALMNAGDLILLGEAFQDTTAIEEGYARLERIVVCTWEGGTHEYNSPTYYGVDLDDLFLLEAYGQRERGREQARVLLEYFWTDIAANWFPAAQKLGGTRSRDYDYLRGLGVLDQHLLAHGWLPETAKVNANNLLAAYAKWTPPPHLLAMANSKFPRYAQQIWGFDPWHGRAHYLCRDVSLSASGASYGGRMDLPLTVDLPGPRERPRCYFIPDARQDPYGKIKIPENKAHSKTIHLNPFWAAAQRKTDALGLVVYREKDLNPTNDTLQSHLVMPLDVDAFWVGDREVKFATNAPAEYAVSAGQPVFLRQGTAAMGIRLPWTRGLDGKPALASLVYDGNPYGAVRLSVNHHSATIRQFAGTNAGALWWVRIGSELTPGAFERWKETFASAPCQVSAGLTSIVATATGIEGPLTVAAAAPFTAPTKLEPPYPRHLLAVDGEDLGRKLLRNVEPLKSYTALENTKVITVPDSGTVSWEAETGRFLLPFRTDRDPAASGGAFAWMPALPGERNSSAIARAAYRLKIHKAGDYYLWAKVQSPTPENDSFYIKVISAEQVLLENTAWPVNVNKQWTWQPFKLGTPARPAPLSLPAGEVTLELRAREAGTKADRLFLTLDPQGPKE